jgi:hypothetical protein
MAKVLGPRGRGVGESLRPSRPAFSSTAADLERATSQTRVTSFPMVNLIIWLKETNPAERLVPRRGMPPLPLPCLDAVGDDAPRAALRPWCRGGPPMTPGMAERPARASGAFRLLRAQRRPDRRRCQTNSRVKLPESSFLRRSSRPRRMPIYETRGSPSSLRVTRTPPRSGRDPSSAAGLAPRGKKEPRTRSRGSFLRPPADTRRHHIPYDLRHRWPAA